MSSLFLSYDHRDKSFVRRLTVDLQRHDIKVWVDEIDGIAGESLFDSIQAGIQSTEYFGVVLSPCSLESIWVQREVEAALVEEMSQKRVKIVPLLLVDCKVPPFLAGKIYIDFRSPEVYPTGLGKLMQRLGAPSSPPSTLTLEAAAAALRHFADTHGLALGDVSEAPPSPLGTAAFKVRLQDGKGAIYYHASGPLRSRIFHVRKGIGWYYEYVLGGSGSALGLPTSHEERRDRAGSQISYFEGGYIEWTPRGSLARAVATTSGAEVLIAEQEL